MTLRITTYIVTHTHTHTHTQWHGKEAVQRNTKVGGVMDTNMYSMYLFMSCWHTMGRIAQL